MLVEASKSRLGKADVARLTAEAAAVVVAQRGKILTFDMKTTRPDDPELLAAMLGPTGNLRAPTLRVGKTLLVGFHPEMYAAALK